MLFIYFCSGPYIFDIHLVLPGNLMHCLLNIRSSKKQFICKIPYFSTHSIETWKSTSRSNTLNKILLHMITLNYRTQFQLVQMASYLDLYHYLVPVKSTVYLSCVAKYINYKYIGKGWQITKSAYEPSIYLNY